MHSNLARQGESSTNPYSRSSLYREEDSNENSLILSQDKRRGWVTRNTTHSSVHSCPVSFFSGPPSTPFVPYRPFRTPHSIHRNTALLPILPRSHGPISSAFVFSPRSFFPLSFLPERSRALFPASFPSPSYLPSPRRRPPPASFVLLFCRRARPAGISLLLHGTSRSFSFFSPRAPRI